ncbi:hypothetical protein CI109_103934 [Kwoniella shandongensis]|uniref:Tyrosine specific protein phosphatases domain-containing protein n=1 Tax=Kwoniella shandongensis TaxID=1734106 RepID=A0A5M6BT29_9TREE|nr:uncharacterized protein CI109_005612 [Kwoniella shandongensis]KAA5526016.1 hypothetical protein CI109_005612 [Kwoniella shandongensis]
MSRAVTATPPPQTYFPQRNTTPTMRHASAPVTAAHFNNRTTYHHSGKRRTKNLPNASGANGTSPLKKAATSGGSTTEGLGLSFEDLGAESADVVHSPGFSRQESTASYASTSSDENAQVEMMSTDSPQSLADESRASPPSTAASVTSGLSRVPTQILTPAMSEAAFPVSVSLSPTSESIGLANNTIQLDAPVAPRASWVGKVAMAVVNTGMSMGMSFGQNQQKAKRDGSISSQSVSPPPVAGPVLAQAVSIPLPVAQPTQEELQVLSEEEQLARKREWAEAENRRVTECARLCSQWPQSGYNLSKHGPNGSSCFYQPQSYANPHHVASLMQRQAELEHFLCINSAMFFSCQRSSNRESSDDDTENSIESYQSSQNSPTASMNFSSDDALAAAMSEQRTAADIKAAMSSPLVSLTKLPNSSQASIQLQDSPKSLKGQRSLTELDSLASSMILSKDDSAMDIDQTDAASIASMAASSDMSESRSITRSGRAQSCGAKRPAVGDSCEEEKRRKVDEAMVVEDAIETGVIMPNPPTGRTGSSPENRMSSSVPDMSKARAEAQAAQAPPAVFGHVVKTSDTHPIIISPFFPVDLLPILSQHLVMPPPTGPFSQTPLLLGSAIDVPSLLLSHGPPSHNPAIVPSPVQSSFRQTQINQQRHQLHPVGNLLLSSCPGKRLRMDGPSRGRGPVCRDLATDLRRIKNEGVGCLVCCLDDTELSLLGVPWETYREIAAETGLDVIRLPMPDGFTPVSMGLFDAQVTLIATKYTLQGINVLVHCRGGVGRAGLTACAWAIKMGFVQPHPSLAIVEEAAKRQSQSSQDPPPAELEHQIVMSIVERVIAMIRCRRGLKAIESFEQVMFLARYVGWLREEVRRS